VLHLGQEDRQKLFPHAFATNIRPGALGVGPTALEIWKRQALRQLGNGPSGGKNVVSAVPNHHTCSVRIGPRVKSLKL